MSKILIISPHMDDEVLGCGGTIRKHVKNSDAIHVIIAANRVYGHKFDPKKNEHERSHVLKAQKILGYDAVTFLDLPDERLDGMVQDIIIPLEKHIDAIKPDTVYVPFRGDNNQDHRAIYDAVRVVIRPGATPFIKNIYMYEISSSTEQSPPLLENAFFPNYYVDISDFIEDKLKALSCYETEVRKYPHPRSLEAVRILAQKRGVEIGFEFAEAFMSLRGVWE
jgi:LmbE family N-acetylglucosaminyl deacetylase